LFTFFSSSTKISQVFLSWRSHILQFIFVRIAPSSVMSEEREHKTLAPSDMTSVVDAHTPVETLRLTEAAGIAKARLSSSKAFSLAFSSRSGQASTF
jgi:hypothetical protein